MEIFDLLPRNRNNLIAYSIHKANAYAHEATRTGLHTHNLVAKFFACVTPFAAFTCGTKALSVGLWQMTVTWIRPKWSAKHINGLEEIKTGLRAFTFVPIAITYAALSILLGPTFIQKYEIPFEFEYTYDANIANCKFSGSATHHHIVNHEGHLVIRQKIFKLELENETIQILRETFELAKARARSSLFPTGMSDFKAVLAVICKTDSSSSSSDWALLQSEAKRLSRLDDALLYNTIAEAPPPHIAKAYKKILNGVAYSTEVFRRADAMSFLQSLYSKNTVEQVFSFYVASDDHFISTRVLHAIIIGLQANLTSSDISTLTPEELEKKRKKLPEPIRYYSDYHYYQLEKDLYFLQQLTFVDKFNTDFGEKSLTEYLTKHIAYPIYGKNSLRLDLTDTRTPNFVRGVLFPCYRQGKKILMKVTDGEALDGLNMSQVQDLDHTFGATLFRGTSDLNSLMRDLEYVTGGVGIHSFERGRQALLDTFGKNEKPDTWYVLGHSLGGSDSMRFTVALVEAAVKKQLKLPRYFYLGTFNSPKIEKELNRKLISLIKKLDPNLHQLRFFHDRVWGDLVQVFGGSLLGEGNDCAILSFTKEVRSIEEKYHLKRKMSSIREYVSEFFTALMQRHTVTMYSADSNLTHVEHPKAKLNDLSGTQALSASL